MLRQGKPAAIFSGYLRRLLSLSDSILDIGTSQRFAKELKPYEALFEGKKYVAAGYLPPRGHGEYDCDCHQDIEKMDFEDGRFDAVICLEVLEHVGNPFRAAREIARVLRPGGHLLLTAPFLAQHHGKGSVSQRHDGYPDYWRFTHEGLRRMFGDFRDVEVVPLDGPIEFRLKQFVNPRILEASLVRRVIDAVDPARPGRATTRHLLFGLR